MLLYTYNNIVPSILIVYSDITYVNGTKIATLLYSYKKNKIIQDILKALAIGVR